ncbi:hypothetical protein FIBSPDRAFT_849276 [Athelia psychrophila]|uniref:Uncharacterized protein n=1 Tax=Athelia psychrophila TaxID=1759441 RepID=A0A166UK83_9AGAM|nr:hypothetical protein FIBSPDRAFT_849276 [Fibularhizoctonia sp. CBS 109695]
MVHRLPHIIVPADLGSRVDYGIQVYFPDLLAPLLRTLIHITSPPFTFTAPGAEDSQVDTKVVISYKIRSLAKETAFWAAFGLWFAFEPAMTRATPDSNSDTNTNTNWRRLGASTDAFVFVARRRPESRGWAVPASDGALLAGVGAWGSETGRCDDTFETLLLMGLDGDGDDEGARSASAA